jgi:hypothetical protein
MGSNRGKDISSVECVTDRMPEIATILYAEAGYFFRISEHHTQKTVVRCQKRVTLRNGKETNPLRPDTRINYSEKDGSRGKFPKSRSQDKGPAHDILWSNLVTDVHNTQGGIDAKHDCLDYPHIRVL